ncbi:MAG: rubredoxin [Methanomicrobiaceae archaeon]|nr:rubredoxin [Methanomicrobiaceae archaeon]
MDRYKCTICGHIYDPRKGEPLQDIRPGIVFENLAEDWRCPVCAAEKRLFKKME